MWNILLCSVHLCIATLIPCTDFCLCWLVYCPSFVVGVGMSSLSMLPMLNNQSLEFLRTGWYWHILIQWAFSYYFITRMRKKKAKTCWSHFRFYLCYWIINTENHLWDAIKMKTIFTMCIELMYILWEKKIIWFCISELEIII